MNKGIVSVFLLFCFMYLNTSLNAQDFSNKGREFWVVFPPHAPNGTNLANLSLYISSDKNSSGYIIINGDSTRFLVTAFTPNEYILDRASTYVSGPESATDTDNNTLQKVVLNKGIKVVVDAGMPNVVVYAHMYANARSASTIILPTSVLERRYQVISFTQSANTLENGENRKSQFSIVAVEDNTTVRIQLRKNGILTGATYDVNLLTAGTIYSFQDNVDLTGTSIESIANNGNLCKKIAVFSGSSSLSIGTTSGSVDPLFQQCYPVNSWGLNYFITPFSGKNKFIIRILAKENNTSVVINGQPPIVLNANEYYQASFSNILPFAINGNKPICVAQYAYTQTLDIGVGDPDMIILNPIEQNLNDVTVFLTSKNNITDQNINVVIRDEGISSFKINGQQPNGVFRKIVNTNYSYLQEKMTVPAGSFLNVRLSSDSGFNAFCYGFGSVESYMYSAGTNVKDLFQKLLITNKFASVTSEAVTCVGAPFIASITLPYKPVSIKWKIPNYTQIDDFSPVPFDSSFINNKQVYAYRLSSDLTFNIKGTYTFLVIVNNPTADGCTGEQEISFDLDVIGPPTVKSIIRSTNCLNDAITFNDETVLIETGRVISYYKWDLGNGVFIDRASNFNYNYNNAGQYNIKHFVINDIGCVSDTSSVNIIIDRNPTVDFSISSIRCQNKDILFTDNSIINGTSIIKKWIWNFDKNTGIDTLFSNQPILHLFDSASVYNVSLSLVTENGCETKISKPLVINPIPIPGFTMPKICLEDSFALFTNTSKIADPNTRLNYNWNFGDSVNMQFSNTDTSTSPKHRYLISGNYNVKLNVTSLEGCYAEVQNTFTVNGSIPKATFKVLNDTALCSNETVKVVNNASVDFGTIGRLVVYWDFDNNILDTSVDENPTYGEIYVHDYKNYSYPNKTNFNIKLLAYSGGACFDDTTVSIAILPPPNTLDINSRTNYLCSYDTLSINLNVAGGVPPFKSYWSSSDTNIGVFNGNILYGSNAGSIDLSLKLVDSKNCTFSYPNLKNFTIKSLPTPILNAKDTVICNDAPIVLRGAGGSSYEWYLNNNTFLISNVDSLTTNLAGKYQLIVNDGFCNSLKSSIVPIESLSIPKYNIQYNAYACVDGSLNITTNAVPQAHVYYLWNFGDSSYSKMTQPLSHSYKFKGKYAIQLSVTNDFCPASQYTIIGDSVNVVASLPSSNFTLFVLGDQDTLISPKRIDTGYTNYHWYPTQNLSNPNTANPIFRNDKSITYTLTRSNPITECFVLDTYNIVVSNDFVITLPKAFSPNGDQLNDLLKVVYGAGLKTFLQFRLFNKYGKVVFQTKNINDGWDGKVNGIDQEIDAYTYFIEYINYKDEHFTKTGSVILLR